jgi:hypothetical protein
MESPISGQPAPAAGVVSREGPRGPAWKTPTRYGSAEAVTGMGTIAAPLLAGFSLAAFVQAFALSTRDVRYRDVAALLLLLAAVFLVMAVQATFWARQYQVTPAQLREWWDDATEPYRLEMLKNEQAQHMERFKIWSRRTRIAFDVGLLWLLAGLTVLAIPPVSGNPPARWASVGVGAIAFVLELGWVITSFLPPRRSRAVAVKTSGSLIFLMYLWLVYWSSGRCA